MERAWEKYIKRVTPYTPGEQPKRKDVIKLNTNENPYPPAPGVVSALKNLDIDALRKYPDPTISALVEAIARNYGVKSENVFVGVGSDDVLGMAFLTFFHSESPIFFPDITYSFYDVWADLFDISYQTKPLDENFCLVKEDYFEKNGGIVIANPNAPTGVLMPLSEVEEIVKKNQESVVIVDEAYVDFGGESAIALTKKYENLLVVQTLSKSRSLAGMRVGFAIGEARLIQAMQDVKYSYNSYTMNLPAIVLGKAAIEDRKYFEETVKKVIATRERTKQALKELGFAFADSKTNFIFAKREGTNAKDLFEKLKEAGIFVRYFNKERLSEYLRISIGTDKEMDALIAFIKSYLS